MTEPKALVWQPIETAPKEIRVLVGGGDCPYVHENMLRCFGVSGCAWGGLGNKQQPTHWMPMPAPPHECNRRHASEAVHRRKGA